MKNLVGFNLFESAGFNYKELFLNKDYKNHLEFALKGMAKCNEERDFPRWAAYKAYLNSILSLDVPESVLSSIETDKTTPYPQGYLTSFDFDKEIAIDSSLGVKSVNWFINNFLVEKIKRIPPVNSAVTMEVKDAIASAVQESIKNVINEIFLPSNISNIQKLKYLDYFLASDLYKGIEFSTDLGNRIFNFLKIFAIYDMEYFKNIPLPERMANYVVLYFRESEDSFKAADELRKSNVGIYNRVKELLPNIDTAADLGDLGF